MSGFLILRFSSLGDVVLATSAARRIRARRPDARVVLATKAQFAPLFLGHPDIDEVWPLERRGLGPLVDRVRSEGFEAVVDLHANWRSRLVAALSNAPVARWESRGLNRRLRVWAPFLKLEEPPAVAVRYARAADRALNLAKGPASAADLSAALPRLGVDPAALAWAKDWLQAKGLRPGQKLLAVAPGAAWPSKRWGAEHLAQCLDLVAEFDRVLFLLLGSPAESPLMNSVAGYLKKSRACVLRSEQDTGDLRRLAALVSRADAFLGHDSGPMHVAEALGVPVTALFGPTVRGFGFFPQGPGHRVFERDLACRPCSVHGTEACPLGHHDCMQTLEPFDVSLHLRRVLGLEGAAA